jgi:hypothetical protein
MGGLWAYILFIKRRQRFPQAMITHTILHRNIQPSVELDEGSRVENKVLLRVAVTIANKGNILLKLKQGVTWVQKVLPLPKSVIEDIEYGVNPIKENETEIGWTLVDYRPHTWRRNRLQIEPGESETIYCDVIIDSTIQTVLLYSHFKNRKKRHQLGWSLSTIYDLK